MGGFLFTIPQDVAIIWIESGTRVVLLARKVAAIGEER